MGAIREEMVMIARLILKNHANGYKPREEDAVRLAELVMELAGARP